MLRNGACHGDAREPQGDVARPFRAFFVRGARDHLLLTPAAAALLNRLLSTAAHTILTMESNPPTLNHVLWLLADNGYLAEVDGGAFGVNRDAWTDERLLRSITRRQYKRVWSHQIRSRLLYAVKTNDYERAALYCRFASTAATTAALIAAIEMGHDTHKTAALLISNGADVLACLSNSTYPGFTFTALEFSQQTIRALCLHPVVTPAIALRAAISVLLPDVVRAHLDAGFAAWKVEAGLAGLGFASSVFNFLGHGIFGQLDSESLNLESDANMEEVVTTIRALFSHPTFSLSDSLRAAKVVNSSAWVRELLAPSVLEHLAEYGGDQLLNGAFLAACAVGAEDLAGHFLAHGANPTIVDPFATQSWRVSPLFIAAERRHAGVVRLLATHDAVAVGDVLLAACAVDLPDVVLATIVERGADVNGESYHSPVSDINFHTTLAVACFTGSVPCVETLLAHGARVNRRTMQQLLYNRTPYRVAVYETLFV